MRISRLFLVCFVILFLCGCENSVPNILSINAFLVCDFESEAVSPEFRLAVFADVASDAGRSSSLKISSRSADGYEWLIENFVSAREDRHQWVGNANLVCPNGLPAPLGRYEAVYTDLAGQTKETSFNLAYPEWVISIYAGDFPDAMGEGYREDVAVFSEGDVLIYYGERKNEWTSDSEIFLANEGAKYLRKCYSDAQKSVLFVMPRIMNSSISE